MSSVFQAIVPVCIRDGLSLNLTNHIPTPFLSFLHGGCILGLREPSTTKVYWFCRFFQRYKICDGHTVTYL
jgi:hypothetical protein